MNVLNTKEGAKRLGVCKRTLERLIELGEGPTTIQLTARRKGILESDFNEWMAARRKPSPFMAARR